MMNRSKMPLTFSLTLWNKKTRIILPCVNIRNISSLPVLYALSDFLIMILSWLVKQSLRAFLFQEVQL